MATLRVVVSTVVLRMAQRLASVPHQIRPRASPRSPWDRLRSGCAFQPFQLPLSVTDEVRYSSNAAKRPHVSAAPSLQSWGPRPRRACEVAAGRGGVVAPEQGRRTAHRQVRDNRVEAVTGHGGAVALDQGQAANLSGTHMWLPSPTGVARRQHATAVPSLSSRAKWQPPAAPST